MHLRRQRLSLDEMAAKMDGDGGLGPVLFVLTLPILLPLPPGVSMVLAAPLLMVAPQIAVGRRRLWLPKALGRQTIKRPALTKLLRRILPLLERAETVVHPRLGFLTGRIGAAMIGLACTAVALVLILPIPFANLVPALTMATFSLGLTRKDGLFVLAGYGLLAASAAVIVLGVHGFTFGLNYLKAMF
ncbi:MAG TPA: exopolysaccharide biosynthesis protein [Caulobacteraceae bacterium]